jgi:drug/metabolite transporter (DMT)-like permease
MSATRLRADAALVGAAFLFGGTFLVVQEGVEQADPVPFIGVRYLVAVAVLAPFALRRPATPGVVRDGVLAGVALGAGYVFQTAGLQYTTSSTSAFITYLLVVFVPLIAAVAVRRPPHVTTVAGVAIAVVGLALLTGGGSGSFGKGEVLTLGCAVSFAAHIVVVAQVVRRHDVLLLTLVQLTTVCAACGAAGFLLGGYGFGAKGWAAAVATGVGATAVAFVLQIWAQRVVGPTRTAIVLLLEPVFAAVLGYLTGERLGWIGAAGALLILVAVALTEVLPQLLTQRSSVGEPSR